MLQCRQTNQPLSSVVLCPGWQGHLTDLQPIILGDFGYKSNALGSWDPLRRAQVLPYFQAEMSIHACGEYLFALFSSWQHRQGKI